MSNLKIYLTGDICTITSADAKSCALIAPDYEVDKDGLLLFCPREATKSGYRAELVRLVIPELFQQDFYITIIPAWRGPLGYRSNLSADQSEVSLDRYVSKCATVCVRVWGL